jgi:hypothetical protein
MTAVASTALPTKLPPPLLSHGDSGRQHDRLLLARYAAISFFRERRFATLLTFATRPAKRSSWGQRLLAMPID